MDHWGASGNRCRSRSLRNRSLPRNGRLVLRHLAACHGEFAMTDAAMPRHMTVDTDVVRRVGEDHLGPILPEQQIIGAGIERAAVQQAVWSQSPEIARAGDRRRRHIRDVVFGAGRLAGCLGGIVKRDVDVRRREAGELNVEVELDQALQLDARISRSQPAFSASRLSAKT
jgi:hypothetical protein